MKLVKSLMLVVAAGLMMTACGGGSTPSDIAKKVMEASLKFDFETIKKYVSKDNIAKVEEQIAESQTEEVKAQMEMMKSIAEKVTFEVVKEEIAEDGNSATVTVKVANPMTGEQEQTLPFVKEDGEWKISTIPGGGK